MTPPVINQRAFDLLELDGEDLQHQPIEQRRRLRAK
jgi:ATP-dependent DNA ligase